MVIHTRLALTLLASGLLAAGTVYWMCILPDHLGGKDGGRPCDFAALAAAFLAQIGVFLAVMGPVAAFGLANRWTWSVRILTAVSPLFGWLMLTVTLNSYEKTNGPDQLWRYVYEMMLSAGSILLYLLFLICILVVISVDGDRELTAPQQRKRKVKKREADYWLEDEDDD